MHRHFASLIALTFSSPALYGQPMSHTVDELAFLASSVSAIEECEPRAPAVRAVRAIANGIVEADNRSDLESVMAYYADDAVLMPPNEPPVRERASIRSRYEFLFANFVPEIEPEIQEACADGVVAFVRGRNGGRLVAKGSGEVRELDDVYLMLLRRDPGGAWRISHLMWHPQSGSTP